MPTLTLDKKELEDFFEWKKERAAKPVSINNKKKIAYLRSREGFGLLKNSFGKASSVAYVNRARKVWR
jgi:hypothetical protein